MAWRTIGQDLLRRQIGHLRQAAELAHRGLGAITLRVDDQRSLPEAERAVVLERAHSGERALVREMRHSPFDRLFHVRACGVDDASQMREHGPRELGGLPDVGIDAGILPGHRRPHG
jgi:hypothetical protein